MKKTFILSIVILLNLTNVYSQSLENTKDSIYLLNINATYFLFVLECYGDSTNTPYYMIDFPESYYNAESKSVELYSKNDDFKIHDSSVAIIRFESWAHKSYGRGGYGYLKQLSKTSQQIRIDTFVRIDSVSSVGVFYLTVENQKIRLGIGDEIAHKAHNKERTEDVLLDYVTGYSIKNEGFISRNIKYDNE